MKPQEANKLIAEFMGDIYRHTSEDKYHASWDWLMPVIDKVKSIDYDWIDQEAQHIIDEIDHALVCCWGMEDVYRYTVDAIMNYNEWKES